VSIDGVPVPTDRKLAQTSQEHVIDVAFERVDLAGWLFSLTSSGYIRSCAPDHLAFGTSTTDEGQPMAIAAETAGDALLLHRFVAQVHRAERCVLISTSDVFFDGGGRATVQATWTIEVHAVDDGHTRYINTVSAEATDSFLRHLENAGMPFADAAARVEAAGAEHNGRETPAFAASIEHYAAQSR
jgi:hypothetical protein